MGLPQIDTFVKEQDRDDYFYDRFNLLNKLQMNIAKEFTITEDIQNAFKEKNKNDINRINENSKYNYKYYFDKTATYLGKLKEKIRANKGDAERLVAPIERSLNIVSKYLELYGHDNHNLFTLGTIGTMDTEKGKEIKRDDFTAIQVSTVTNSFTFNLNSSILNNQDAIDAFDKLKDAFKAAKIDFENMDDPEVKFICHITQGVKNTVQKSEIFLSQVDFFESHKNISNINAQKKSIKNDKLAIALECSKNKLSASTMENQLDEQITDIEKKVREYKKKTDLEINRIIDKRIAKIDEVSNQKKKELNDAIEKEEKLLRDTETELNNNNASVNKYEKEFNESNILVLKLKSEYENIITEKSNYDDLVKSYNTSLDNIAKQEKELENLKNSFAEISKQYDDYAYESAETIQKKVDEDTIKLAEVLPLRELIVQNKTLHEEADFVKNFDPKTASKEDFKKLNDILSIYFGDSDEEAQTLINSAQNLIKLNGDVEALATIKKEFSAKSALRSQSISNMYRAQRQGKNIDDINLDELDSLQLKISANQSRVKTIKNMSKEEIDNIRTKYNELNEQITIKSKDVDELKLNGKNILEKLQTNYGITGEGKDINSAEIGEKLLAEANKKNIEFKNAQNNANGIEHSLKISKANHSKNKEKFEALEKKHTQNKKKTEKEISELDEKVKTKKANIKEDANIKPIIKLQADNLEKANIILENKKKYKEGLIDAVKNVTNKEVQNSIEFNDLLENIPDEYNDTIVKISNHIGKELKNFEIRSLDASNKTLSNTSFYENMMESVANARMTLAMGEDSSLEEKIAALQNIKEKSNAYLEEKKSQVRPFASQIRKTRMQFAEDLKKYAESSIKDLTEGVKEYNVVKDIENFIDKDPIDVESIDSNSIKAELTNLQNEKIIKDQAEKSIKKKEEQKFVDEALDLSLDTHQYKRNDKEEYPYEPEFSFDNLYKESFEKVM